MQPGKNSVIKGMDYIDTACTGIADSVINEIRELAEKHDVDRVVLFGSRARGDYKRVSDIDLAVLGGNFPAFALDVEEETSTLLEFDFVDLGADVQDGLIKEIGRDGKLIYEKV